MAGKRPDQYQIDPSEGRSTDHKFNPQNSHGEMGDLTEMRRGDKQRLTESKRGGQPFLPDVPAPSAEAQRAARQTDDEGVPQHGPVGAADSNPGKENPLV